MMISLGIRTVAGRLCSIALSVMIGGCATLPGPVDTAPPGRTYVAMGSSFAAGPGIAPMAQPGDRCGRSTGNYAHQLARLRRLELIDVTCSGATTEHILGPWQDVPPQINAVTRDTALVTITIGGNDVGYIGGLSWAACSRLPADRRDPRCKEAPAVTEQAWQSLAVSLRRVVSETRARAPSARIVLVDYLTVLPPTGTCARIAMPADAAVASRAVATRLAALTASVARAAQVDVLRASRLSAGHGACAPDPWTSGFPSPDGPPVMVPFHPNLAGMTAVAQALDRLLQAR
ncbi:MAG TPA: SGNH/GDSL hydrolase family protein [Sphingomonas sp.]|uniref:SGNH/GDSL hydrolase family protein n=1 Tax=Sphingomonas sp. TaxID=28214 RepID=UPI002EDB5D5C